MMSRLPISVKFKYAAALLGIQATAGLKGRVMHQVKVVCPNCQMPGAGPLRMNCTKCGGTGFVYESRMDPGPARGFLRLVVIGAAIMLTYWYVTGITYHGY